MGRMPDEYGLVATERAMAVHLGAHDLDFPAAAAVSSLLRAASAVRNHVTNTVLRERGLSWTGFVVLWVVWIFDGLETRHAAQSAAISKGTLTGVAKTLESRGWLRREPDGADRRLVHLDGLALMQDLSPKINAVEAEIVSRLERSGLRSFTDQLRTMALTAGDAQPGAEGPEGVLHAREGGLHL
jgi:DNA-binding MarR family transcriptional regulator